ncbi:MAG TPA: hypothetical protein VEW71_09690 [Allosphingosinicella sp.]|nr:hypothetical protein [Allosphingosinicella sp.]
MPKLHAEPLLFCFAWAALAIAGGVLAGRWAALILSLGLLPILMAATALILAKMEDFAFERQVRWGIIVLAALALGAYLRS